jgi:alpha-tubulin suppressor-like RCC1 family protein
VAYCWGSEFNGELGDGTTLTSATPVRVSGGQQFASLSAGYYHTCGVTISAAVYCWGSDQTGLLGNGIYAPFTGSSVPVPVVGGISFK